MSTATANIPATQTAAVPMVKPTTIKGWLQSDGLKAEIAKALPRHCSPERMMRIAITAVTRTPELAQCEPASFMRCLLDLSQWGLEPNGRDAHLIPFRNNKRGVMECQLIVDYKGLVQLLYRADKVLSVHADVVREGDDFDYSTGMVRRHVPHFLRKGPKQPTPGKVIAAYCKVELKGGAVKCELMEKAAIDAIRKRSRASSSGPWVTDYDEMAKKTVFRRASKWLPLSAEILDAFERDYDSPDFSPPLAAAAASSQSLDQLAETLSGNGSEHGDAEPNPSESADVVDQPTDDIPPPPPAPAADGMSDEEKAEILAAEAAEQRTEGALFDTSDELKGVGQ